MICNTALRIAVKNEMGQYEEKQISLFELYNIHEKYGNLEISNNRSREIKFKIKCPICNRTHYYRYSLIELMKREMIVSGCEIIGIPVFFIGNNEKVIERINKYKEINKKVYAMIWVYVSVLRFFYFKNDGRIFYWYIINLRLSYKNKWNIYLYLKITIFIDNIKKMGYNWFNV